MFGISKIDLSSDLVTNFFFFTGALPGFELTLQDIALNFDNDIMIMTLTSVSAHKWSSYFWVLDRYAGCLHILGIIIDPQTLLRTPA